MTAGESTANDFAGGKVNIFGGLGSSGDSRTGGDGGKVEIFGGTSEASA